MMQVKLVSVALYCFVGKCKSIDSEYVISGVWTKAASCQQESK